ncbi:MAG: right-handed parallel beta-helix repeat-containing protein [Lewinellaceae bacterium]|nr:right-handed parallel beta-helix repeat-containing protein [Phaeodactylibacter sp.]MCB9037044.1 right-handed parallel beta-helix repeat-containing protein [Lewinellaceae bacterium]
MKTPNTWPLFLAILLNLNLSLNLSLHATTYYVAPTGSNTNTGLSLADAFLTLQFAAEAVQAGDTVFAADGTYAGFDLRDKNGTSAAPIVFQALGNSAVIDQSGPIRNDGINIENADYVVVDGFAVNGMPGNGNGIRVVLSDHCAVRNCRCDGNAERGIFTGFTDDILIEYNVCTNSVDEHGIYVSNSSDRPVIRYNECYGNNNIGIHINADLSEGGDGIISDAQVYGNVIHDNGLAAGINMDGLQNPVVYNNLIYNNHFGQGIALFQQDGAIVTNGAKIYNNTIIVPEDGRWGILVKAGANQNTEIYNNIILNRHAWRGCIAAEETAGLQCDYNMLNDKMSADGDGSAVSLAAWQALGFDGHSLLAEPLATLFQNAAGNDYHLRAGAQAIDAGTNLVAALVNDDLDGHARPIGAGFDMGCYEFALPDGISGAASLEFLVFPNPAKDVIHLDYDERQMEVQRFELVDVSGRIIRAFGSSSRTLDIRGLPNGLYGLRIFLVAGGVAVRKILISTL